VLIDPSDITAADMLRPTLENECAYRCACSDGALAVLMIGQSHSKKALQIACEVHQHLERGLLVVL
jgi:hypothetical protein